MPRIGLGVWKIDDTRVFQTVSWALAARYRHIDTARAYGNEAGVGRGVHQSGLARNQLFLTTKLAISDIFKPEKAFEESLRKLRVDYVDLYLIHWPFFGWKRAWSALEKIYADGRAKAIGVSNFGIGHLRELKRRGGVMPMVNQIELSPFLNRQRLVAHCQSLGIVVEAYSPLTRGKRLADQVLADMARNYKKSPAQIMIRWGLQHDLVMIPKSTSESHIKDNIDVFDFEIEKKDMQKLDALNENYTTLPGWSRG